jgi:hypothetical protein
MNRSQELDIISRALSVIEESDDHEEHGELIHDLRELIADGEEDERNTPEELIEDEELVDLVADQLVKLGFPRAFGESTGGNIYCVIVPTGDWPDGSGPNDGEWVFGMADETWGGGWSSKEGGYFESTYLRTEVPSDEQDPKVIAEALAKLLKAEGDAKLQNKGEAS